MAFADSVLGGNRVAMAGQGTRMQDSEIEVVISLLGSTEMTIPEIAERMGCSRSTIVAVNRRFQVRQYQGRRSTWMLGPSERIRRTSANPARFRQD
jgi:hypothetical protein